jgi:hypothetical protein
MDVIRLDEIKKLATTKTIAEISKILNIKSRTVRCIINVHKIDYVGGCKGRKFCSYDKSQRIRRPNKLIQGGNDIKHIEQIRALNNTQLNNDIDNLFKPTDAAMFIKRQEELLDEQLNMLSVKTT